jgi:hypothetical protein
MTPSPRLPMYQTRRVVPCSRQPLFRPFSPISEDTYCPDILPGRLNALAPRFRAKGQHSNRRAARAVKHPSDINGPCEPPLRTVPSVNTKARACHVSKLLVLVLFYFIFRLAHPRFMLRWLGATWNQGRSTFTHRPGSLLVYFLVWSIGFSGTTDSRSGNLLRLFLRPSAFAPVRR